MIDPPHATVFRPSFSRTTAAVVMVLCGVSAVSLAIADPSQALAWTPWLLLVAGVAWALYWRPRVVVTDGGVTLVNVFSTIDVPWPVITDVHTKWALTLATGLGSVQAWAAPAPGRQVMRRSQPEDRRIGGQRRGDSVRPSDLPATESGAAALIVRERWLRLREAGHLENPRIEFERLPRTWHVHVIVGTVAVCTLCAASLFA